MQLVHLSLTNFRNFIRLEMEFPPGPTLVVGPNAQGKTSLLEAIDYLVGAESPRAGSDRELVNFLVERQPGAFARIVAEFHRGDRGSSRASSRLHRASSPLGTLEGHPEGRAPGGNRVGDRPHRIEVRLVADSAEANGVQERSGSTRDALRQGSPRTRSEANGDDEGIEPGAASNYPPQAALTGGDMPDDRLASTSAEPGVGRWESTRGLAGEGRFRKEILLNGVRRRAADLAGELNAVLFLPDDLHVIEGPPAGRRRLLDRTLCQADPAYAEALSEYSRLLTQRNALLRQIQQRPFDERQLDPWDAQLVDLAVQLIRGRAVALAELERLAGPIHETLTAGGEQLRLTYLPARLGRRDEGQLRLPLAADLDWSTVAAASIADEVRRAMAAARPDEIERGVTLVGPHRDDVRFVADGVDLRPYGSRGQNRTAMISVRLAQGEWIQQRTGEWPILLLDETLAELDERRRAQVLERIATAPQAILTAADLNLFPATFREAANVWELRGGTLSRIARDS